MNENLEMPARAQAFLAEAVSRVREGLIERAREEMTLDDAHDLINAVKIAHIDDDEIRMACYNAMTAINSLIILVDAR